MAHWRSCLLQALRRLERRTDLAQVPKNCVLQVPCLRVEKTSRRRNEIPSVTWRPRATACPAKKHTAYGFRGVPHSAFPASLTE